MTVMVVDGRFSGRLLAIISLLSLHDFVYRLVDVNDRIMDGGSWVIEDQKGKTCFQSARFNFQLSTNEVSLQQQQSGR